MIGGNLYYKVENNEVIDLLVLGYVENKKGYKRAKAPETRVGECRS